MQETDVIKLMYDALVITIKISAPMLAMSMAVGLVISIIQTTTSIQEQTLTFVPKLLGVFISIVLFASWILHTVVDYTKGVFFLIQKF